MVNFADTVAEAKNNDGNSAVESPVAPPEKYPHRTCPDDTKQEDDDRKKRKRDRKKSRGRSLKRRHYSIGKAARDPRDEASPPHEPQPGSRSPSPVIDFDGLSRPSKYLNLCQFF